MYWDKERRKRFQFYTLLAYVPVCKHESLFYHFHPLRSPRAFSVSSKRFGIWFRGSFAIRSEHWLIKTGDCRNNWHFIRTNINGPDLIFCFVAYAASFVEELSVFPNESLQSVQCGQRFRELFLRTLIQSRTLIKLKLGWTWRRLWRKPFWGNWAVGPSTYVQ